MLAARDFVEDEVITEVDGMLCLTPEQASGRYALWLQEDLYLEIVDQARWINHSCDPNVWIDGGVRDDGTPWARVIALRAIRKREELTCDYALPVELAEPCTCGAPTCRRWIMDQQDGELARAPAPA